MIRNRDYLTELFRKLSQGTLTEPERSELAMAIEIYPAEELHNLMKTVEEETKNRTGPFPEDLWPYIAAIPEGPYPHPDGGARRSYSRLYLTVAAAAVLAALIVLAFRFYFPVNRHAGKVLSRCDSIQVYHNGIPPGVDEASLTLANGSQLLLDSNFHHLDIVQGSSVLRRLPTGEFQFTNKPGKITDSVFYNTVTTSRGTQCVLFLPDGSTARLNAASSIRFPLHFSGPAREVYIQGEVFFDIKKAGTPFYVRVNPTTRLEVTGTSFNVNAYDRKIATTLVSGRLTIKTGDESALLKPGQEATLSLPGERGRLSGIKVQKANITQAISWKKGYLIFRNEPMPDALEEIARWYGLELVNPDRIPGYFRFSQVICRGMEFPELVRLLHGRGLDFRVEGRKLIF